MTNDEESQYGLFTPTDLAARDAADWSSLIQYLQQIIILGENSPDKEIVKHQETLLELALSILEMGDFQQRWEITKVLTNLGNIAIAPLVDILKDEDAEEELRWYAARTLGEFKHPDVIPPLVELLHREENEELKAMASTALGQMGTVAIAPLSELLIDENTRLLAVRSLCYIPHPETIVPLLGVVADRQPAVRAAAIEALSRFDDERVPPVLVKALDDLASGVRQAAVLGLGCRPDLCEALDLVTKLQSRLYDLNEDVSCATAIALSRMGGDAATQHLFRVLISPYTPLKLQLEIVRAFSWMGTLSAVQYLQQALNQCTEITICQEIVTVLGRVQQPQLTQLAAEILLAILQSKHKATEIASFKSAIALSLGQLGRIEAIESLILLLADQDPVVRLHAIAALKNLDSEIAYQQLHQLANNPALTPDLQQGIAIALAEWNR
jgi:HEAT repeat protein